MNIDPGWVIAGVVVLGMLGQGSVALWMIKSHQESLKDMANTMKQFAKELGDLRAELGDRISRIEGMNALANRLERRFGVPLLPHLEKEDG